MSPRILVFLNLALFIFVVPVVCIPYPIGEVPFSNKLKCYYRFEDDPKSGTAKDSSPNSFNAVINSYPNQGIFQRGRAFNGDIMNNGYNFPFSYQALPGPLINFPNIPISVNELSVSFLFETRDTFHQIVFSIEFGSQSIVAFLEQDFMTLDFFGSKNITLSKKFELRALYHFVFVINSNSLHFYVDSNKISSLQSERSFNFGESAKFQLGYSNRKASFSSSFYDEVIIWNRLLDVTEISYLFNQVALGPQVCQNTTNWIEKLYQENECGKDGSLNGKGSIQECGFSSAFRSRGVTCGSDTSTVLMNSTSSPYALRFIDVIEYPTYVSLSFKVLDLCRSTDPNENMEDEVGLCRIGGKYPVFGLCAFNNYCINVGISTSQQRYFFQTGYTLDLSQPMIEFGKVTRPMYSNTPEGMYIFIEMYEDQTLWIGTSEDGLRYQIDVQGHRLNLPFPYHYFKLLRFFSASPEQEVGTVFSSFFFYADNYEFGIPEGCPENQFYNGYECQNCVANSVSPPASDSADDCVCMSGFFADSCRNSPLCSGIKPGFSFTSMNQPQYTKLLGSASLNGDLALLTPNRASQGGGLFFDKPWKLFDFSSPDFAEISFSTYFVFLISDNGGNFLPVSGKWGGDGFAFVMSSKIPSTIGTGNSLGYSGLTNSIVVEFDTFKNLEYKDISDSHVGININGNLISSKQISYEGLKDGKPIHCWIQYDASHGVLDIKLSSTSFEPLDPILSYSIEVERVIGGPDMYIGFTGATGGQYSNHYILKWEFEMEPQLSCSSCPVDHFKDFFGNDACVKCPLGSSTLGKTGANVIQMCQCEPGLYQFFGSCESCEVNTFNPNYGSLGCLPCPIHSSTKGNIGSTACQCDNGYIMENGKCVDFNECSNPQICFNGASCANRDGSYQCICAPGFTGDDCSRDINECATFPCRNGGTCVNTFGSFECMCPSGWKGNTCMEDINECTIQPYPCAKDASCQNTIGSYLCTCNNGLIGDGKYCKESQGPTLIKPNAEDIYARYVKLRFEREPYFNLTSISMELDFTGKTDSPFTISEKRYYLVSPFTSYILIEDLPPFTYIRLRMISNSGSISSPPSNIVSVKTLATSPDAGTLSYKKGIDGRSATISWIPGESNGATVTGFRIVYHLDSRTETTNFTVDPNTLSLTIPNLNPNITYIFFMITTCSDFPNSNPSDPIFVVVDGIPDVVIIDPTEIPPPLTKKSNVGMIVGICVSLIVIAAIVLFFLVYRKKKGYGRIRLPESSASANSKASVGLLSPLDDSLNVPDAFKDDAVDEDATEKEIS